MGGCCSEAEKYCRRCRISGSSRSFAANVSFPGLDLQNAKCAHCRMTELHSIIIGLGRNRLELADSLPTASPLPKQTAEPPVKERAWSLCLFCIFFFCLWHIASDGDHMMWPHFRPTVGCFKSLLSIVTSKAASTPRSLASALLCPTQHERSTEKLDKTLMKTLYLIR